MPTIWFVSANLNERALSVAQLAEEGFEARGFESLAELFAALAAETPDVLIVEALDTDLEASKWATVRILAPSTRTLLLTRAAGPSFPAEAVLLHPFSIGELVGKIRASIK